MRSARLCRDSRVRPMDEKIGEAINVAATNASQEPDVARKIAKWFEAVASGSEGLGDDEAFRHLEVLYNDIRYGDDQEDDGDV